MRLAVTSLCICLAAASPGHAGAWLREDGTTFLSVETTLRHGAGRRHVERSIYLEHGLAPRLTGGLSLFQTANSSGHALVFLRRPLPLGEPSRPISWELGLGGHATAGRWAPMARLTLSAGRSLSWGDARGWANLELAVEYRRGVAGPILKLDATAGRSSAARFRPMLKLNGSLYPGQDPIWSASANLLIDTPRGLTWVLGLEGKRAGRPSGALTLGLWRRF